MRTFTLAVLLVSALATAAATAPQSALELSKGKPDAHRTETKHLTLTTAVGPAGRDGRLELLLTVTPKPKMHVYAPEQNDYIPITLTLTPGAGIQAQKPRYPAAEKYFFAPLKETQLVYSRPFKIVQPVTVTPPAAGPVTIAGTVRYQACDDMICYLPQTVPVSWAIPGRQEGRRP